MSNNIHNLSPDKMTKEAIIKYLEEGEFEDILVITTRDKYMELRNTLGSIAEVNTVLDLMKFSLLLGGYEE